MLTGCNAELSNSKQLRPQEWLDIAADPPVLYAQLVGLETGCRGPKFIKNYIFFANSKIKIFANFWRARSRLYQNENLQEIMRSTAFFKLYKICILLHRCNLKIVAKNRFEKSAIFVKIQQKMLRCCKFYSDLPTFKNFS